MATIGAVRLSEQYGGGLGVAEALLEGKIDAFDQHFVDELVSPMLLEAARIRIEWRRNYSKEALKREITEVLALVAQINGTGDSSSAPPVAEEKEVTHIRVVQDNCHACAYSGMEPDDLNLTCFHVNAGGVGLHVDRAIEQFCTNSRIYFKQHPARNPDGSLKGGTSG